MNDSTVPSPSPNKTQSRWTGPGAASLRTEDLLGISGIRVVVLGVITPGVKAVKTFGWPTGSVGWKTARCKGDHWKRALAIWPASR